ncbi:MAG TPA: hypothetical protein VKK61_00915 [Tepidisphaeraceae bacterium]|nr:hypothetical protein [Tepidisphaeraceae bacterium]
MTQINSSLQEVNQKLGTSGESEAGVNKSMQTIQVSLHRIDDELAALLQMMEKIGNLVPGVHINPDTSVPPPQAPATTQNQ